MKKFVFYFVAFFLIATGALATNGYFAHGYGIRYKGLAGAGVAMYQSSLGAATNPASIVWLETRYDINISAFMPFRKFTITGNPSGATGSFGLTPGEFESDGNFFLVPSLGANWKLDDQSAFGVAIYGNGGMNTEYSATVQGQFGPGGIFYGATPTGVNLSQLFVQATYSRMLGESHSLGLSLIGAAQFFEATGLEAFGANNFSADPTKLTGNDQSSSFGFGLKVGYQGELTEGLRIGGSYQSKMSMGEFAEYEGLFAESGDFDIPATWTAGAAYDISDNFTLAADVQQILYSGVSAISNPLSNLFNPDGSGVLGGDNGAGFGWRDMTVIKIGAQFEVSETLILRAGYSSELDDQPIPESEVMFNILAPGVVSKHITAGLTTAVGDNELSLAIMYAPSSTVSGANPLDPGQTIELEMNQLDIEVGFTF